IGIFTLENVLLAGGLAIVVLSSRVGLLSILLILGYLVIRLAIFLGNRLFTAMFDKFIIIPKKSIRILIQIVLGITLVGISVFVFGRGSLALVKLLGKLDWRLTLLFAGLTLTQLINNPYIFFTQLAFSERFVYWVTGWRVFAGHPLLGVGLGNSGFFFPRYMPSFGWALPEVVDVYVRSPFLPNIKSFWVRLLAETGIIGFAAFLSWYFALWRSSRLSECSTDSLIKAIGWTGQFVLIGFLAEGFSVDTFALPYLWVSLGLLSAASAMFRQRPPLSPHF
ncbi:MAG: O-antigen ligase family protein, partial [Anaerolineales bacterium]|nr:O-antigen ligase family protein [Anaerolineales bacterium]